MRVWYVLKFGSIDIRFEGRMQKDPPGVCEPLHTDRSISAALTHLQTRTVIVEFEGNGHVFTCVWGTTYTSINPAVPLYSAFRLRSRSTTNVTNKFLITVHNSSLVLPRDILAVISRSRRPLLSNLSRTWSSGRKTTCGILCLEERRGWSVHRSAVRYARSEAIPPYYNIGT
jgi:hypothetical protein